MGRRRPGLVRAPGAVPGIRPRRGARPLGWRPGCGGRCRGPCPLVPVLGRGVHPRPRDAHAEGDVGARRRGPRRDDRGARPARGRGRRRLRVRPARPGPCAGGEARVAPDRGPCRRVERALRAPRARGRGRRAQRQGWGGRSARSALTHLGGVGGLAPGRARRAPCRRRRRSRRCRRHRGRERPAPRCARRAAPRDGWSVRAAHPPGAGRGGADARDPRCRHPLARARRRVAPGGLDQPGGVVAARVGKAGPERSGGPSRPAARPGCGAP